LLQLGRILLLSGDYQASRLCLETALAGFEFGKNTPAESECLISLATVCALMQDGACFNDVRAEIDSWLTIMGDHVSTDLSARIHRHMSFAHYLLGEFDMAIAECMEAIANDETLADSENLWRDFFLLSLYESERGHTEESRLHLVHSLELVEKLSCEIERVAFRQAFLGERRLIYERLIDECVEAGERRMAFNFSERAKARTLLDMLAAGPIETLENVAEEGIRTGVVEPSAIKADVDEVVRSLPSDTAALEYFVTDDATYVWVIYQGEIQGPIQLPHGRTELMHKVIDTREHLGSSPEQPFNPRDLVELYNWLIRPVEHLLPETTGEGDVPHLIIIPSGPLYYLPFQALIWTSEDLTENAPLIVRYALSYSPSLATLKYAQALAETAYPQATFLALADPDSGNPRLPDAQAEARAVAQLFTVSSVYVDSYATEDVVQSDSATAREILLSTHGLFNPHNPLYSYLVVSPTAENKDGKLFAHEVFSLPLHANIVVLSACETLLPSLADMKGQIKAVRGADDDTPVKLTNDQLKELTAGDEVVGLTRAFISAGSSSVLSSLWSVPSGSTADLMVSFYKYREEGRDKAQALRAAQLEVMNTTGWTQPWHWAAFNLMGDWR
jgi:CHAT domain-containing protein